MDANQARRLLNELKSDMDYVIRQMDNIAGGINDNFVGIGNDICAEKIWDEQRTLQSVRRDLDTIKIEDSEK